MHDLWKGYTIPVLLVVTLPELEMKIIENQGCYLLKVACRRIIKFR